MDLKKIFATDERREIEGTWIPLPDPAGKARIKVARYGNPNFVRAIDEATRNYRQAGRGIVKIPEEMARKILIETLASTVLLDWENIEDDGKPVPYNRENAEAMLEKYKDFRDFVSSCSTNFELYHVEAMEEGAKNLEDFLPGEHDGPSKAKNG